MNSTLAKVVITVVLIGGCFYTMYKWGQHSSKKITYFSELTDKTQGRKAYLIDMEVICSNGKDIGRLQVDLNLSNGKLEVIRNDSRLQPNCTRLDVPFNPPVR